MASFLTVCRPELTAIRGPGGRVAYGRGVSGHLNPGGQQFRGDRGAADPLLAATLAAYQAGQCSEQEALQALSAARLLVPVVAVLADPGAAAAGAAAAGAAAAGAAAAGAAGAEAAAGPTTAPACHAEKAGDKNSEMMLPTLLGRDGRPALPAFTCLNALALWRKDARPVPAEAARVWRTAVDGGCAVVIDVAGPVPIAVEGARLAALAAGRPAPPPHEDPDVRAEIEAAIAGEPQIAGFTLGPATPGGAELAVRLQLAPGDAELVPNRTAGLNRAANSIAARLAVRLRRGIEISAAQMHQ
jgi:SseB protein N-terminal domain